MPEARRRMFYSCAVAIVIAQFPVSQAFAQNYPSKPIRVMVGTTPGGAADTISRLVASRLSESLGQQVIVENRPGASGAIATERVVKSPPDGYTLQMMTSSTIIVVAMRTNLPFDLERDLAPVSLVSSAPVVLVVHPSVPARNVRELIALARAQPGKLDYASTGVGSVAHLAGELFNSMAKVKLVHVPYKGSAEGLMATVAGEVTINLPSVTSVLSLLGTGKFRPLAVTSAKRSRLAPAIPTIDESGVPGYEYIVWYGIFAPAGVPKSVIAQLNAALFKLNTPEMQEAVMKAGQELQINSAEQFATYTRSDIAKHVKLVKSIGLKPE